MEKATQDAWISVQPLDTQYCSHGVRSLPGLICAMPGWLQHSELSEQQVANHALILATQPANMRILLDALKAAQEDARRNVRLSEFCNAKGALPVTVRMLLLAPFDHAAWNAAIDAAAIKEPK